MADETTALTATADAGVGAPPPEGESSTGSGQEAGGPDQYRNFVGDVTREVLAALSPALDRNFRATQSQVDRFTAQLERVAAAHGATKAEIAEMRELWEQASFQSDEERQAWRDRQDAKRYREREQAQTPARPPAEQPAVVSESDADFAERWNEEHKPDLVDYAKLRGFSDADIQAADWDGRLLAAGAPQAMEDYTPKSIRAYKAGLKAAIDRMAQQKAAAARPRTAPANPTTASGSAGQRFTRADLARWTPDQIAQNIDKVLDQMGTR